MIRLKDTNTKEMVASNANYVWAEFLATLSKRFGNAAEIESMRLGGF